MTLLEIRGLTVGYGGDPVLEDFDLHLDKGEVLAVLGANGAGKSTLLRTISGVLQPTAGTVRLEGESIAGRRPDRLLRAGVAHVLEGRRILSSLSVEENLLLGAIGRGPEVADRLGEMYDIFEDLKRLRRLSGGNLSGGQQQMLAIGRALMARPRVLLLDEPSLGMAPVIVDRLVDLLGELRRRFDTSVLMVEQTVWMALSLADRVGLVQHGRLVFEGAVDSLDESMLGDAYFGGEIMVSRDGP
ncbi:MAG: ABC transporter ATP-binding protein [bacterium]|nr:ABC transporter ATP-binding protein [bacterium]